LFLGGGKLEKGSGTGLWGRFREKGMTLKSVVENNMTSSHRPFMGSSGGGLRIQERSGKRRNQMGRGGE